MVNLLFLECFYFEISHQMALKLTEGPSEDVYAEPGGFLWI